ncbi:hypothetical protein [Streptomyces sp. c-19]|uniref:hypothetical protein n=1 Tax=Streptomyces sp. c-19 TaxID=2789275 RepID=UPI00397FBAA7
MPKDDPAPRSTGQVTGAGGTLTTDKTDPVNPEGRGSGGPSERCRVLGEEDTAAASIGS